MGGRILALLWKTFWERRIPVLAQSLAYTTIFTLVPILAGFYAVLGWQVKDETVKWNIEQFISVYLFPEYVNSIFTQLEKISKASAVFGVIGFLTIFLAGIFLYSKVDSSINEIWLSVKKRKWFKNGLAFFMTLFFGPMILMLMFSIPPYLQTLPYYKEVVSFVHIETLFSQFIPILITSIGLFVLYLYIPVITVKYTAAIRGALIAALLIQISNFFLSIYLQSFSQLDVFYGSLAIIPIFLLWVYIFWTVVLTGAALTFVIHYHENTAYMDTKGMYNYESLLSSALLVMMYLTKSFQDKDGAPNFEHIQVMLGMNRKRLGYIIEVLKQEKMIVVFDEDTGRRGITARYQPGFSPDKIKLISLIPLFYSPREHAVFEDDLNDLMRFFEVHPGFLLEKITLQDLLDNPGKIMADVKKRLNTFLESL